MNNTVLSNELLSNYLKNLVNQFFKILPMREEEEPSLQVYLRSLQSELLGFKELVEALKADSQYTSLLAILQFMIDNPDCPVDDVRREVFRAISICNKLRYRYTKGGVNDERMDNLQSSPRIARKNITGSCIEA